jgi:hypothetical protein
MGQYQQWLQYQEIQKRLSSQAEAIETDIKQLQSYVNQFEQQRSTIPSEPLFDNPIIQALIAHLPSQTISPQNSIQSIDGTTHQSEVCSDEPGDSISPALKSWGELPAFQPHEIEEASPSNHQSASFFNHPEIALLPEDMMAFFDEHEQTDPQLELPWWLRKITISSKDEQSSRPIDYNTVRTNRLVQRWVERWGHQSPTALQPAEQMEEQTHE